MRRRGFRDSAAAVTARPAGARIGFGGWAGRCGRDQAARISAPSVAAFLDRRIGFLDIAAAVAETLSRMDARDLVMAGMGGLEEAMITDASARRVAAEVLPHFQRL